MTLRWEVKFRNMHSAFVKQLLKLSLLRAALRLLSAGIQTKGIAETRLAQALLWYDDTCWKNWNITGKILPISPRSQRGVSQPKPLLSCVSSLAAPAALPGLLPPETLRSTHVCLQSGHHPNWNKESNTIWANAQMICMCHTYTACSQSSPFFNQPSQKFGFLHNTLHRMITQVLAFSEPCDLAWRSMSFKLVLRCKFSGVCHYARFERNWFLNVWRHANIKSILDHITCISFSPLNFDHA